MSRPLTTLTTPPSPRDPGSAATFAAESQLPRVPLPSLDDSCERFLDWCAPLLTDAERAETRAAVAAFRAPDGPGPALHAALERYNARSDVRSWLDTFWPYRYLGRRDRIALNANFFFLFKDTGESQTDRAAGLISAAARYKQLLDAEAVPPAVVRGQPQSMEQYKYLFATTRIPGEDQDTVRAPYSAAEPGPAAARHIVVFRGGHLFRMDILGPGGVPHSLDDLAAGLGAIQRTADEADLPGPGVGSLTTLARAEWARARQALTALDPRNAAALDVVETALFAVCLDSESPGTVQGACDQLLHGGHGDRWYDKAVSFVVLPDGRAGINVEHCELDGTTILSFVDALLAAPASEHSAASGARDQGRPALAPVDFVLDPAARATIRAAADDFAAYAADTASVTVAFDDFGTRDAKALGISPDAFAQLSYQLAHHRAKGRVGATYESIATRQYQRGRTEAMRVVTPQIQEFVAALNDPDATADTRRAALRAAAERHAARARACQRGEAPEQHLWELQLIQRRDGTELGVDQEPALFRSPGWRVMRDDYLSTSSAPSANIQYFGFGSTSAQCVGVAYVLLPDRFHLYLSTPRPVAEQMHQFAARLREAVAELRALLAGH